MAITTSSTVSSPILGCMKNHKSKTAQGMRMKYSNEYEILQPGTTVIWAQSFLQRSTSSYISNAFSEFDSIDRNQRKQNGSQKLLLLCKNIPLMI